jgi:uncharacterized RDD family membrane protein YckC
MNWYYAINGQRQGPVAHSEIERLVSTGVITEQTLVWKEGMADWRPYSVVRETMPPQMPGAGAVAGEAAGVPAEETAICVVSGKAFPKREMIQYEGKWVSAQHRDEFFQRIREGMAPHGEGAVPGPYGYGGFWRRFFAKILDLIILYVVSIPFNVVLGLMAFGSVSLFTPEFDPSSPGALGAILLFQAVSVFINIGLAIAYCLFFVRRYQATPGKMALGLRLVRADGSNLSKGRIVGRYFAEMVSSLIFAIGYIMVAFDNEKKGLHDMICDTRVIKTRR